MNKIGREDVSMAKKKVKAAGLPKSPSKKAIIPSKSPMNKSKSGMLKPPKSGGAPSKSPLPTGQDSLLRDTKRSETSSLHTEIITYSNTEKVPENG